MSRYDLVINGTSYSVIIRQISGQNAVVEVNGAPYSVEMQGGAPVAVAPVAQPVAAPQAPKPAPAAPPKPAAAPAAAPVAGDVIIAPMPGHILSVPVKVGDQVAAGDTVVVMEAMKMENEIKTHVAGKVLEVRVSQGKDVSVNEVLIVVGA